MKVLEAKMLVLGSAGVGKTSLTEQYLSRTQATDTTAIAASSSSHSASTSPSVEHLPQRPPPTIGVTYSVCKVHLPSDDHDEDGDKDTGGQNVPNETTERTSGTRQPQQTRRRRPSRRRPSIVRLHIWDTAGQERFRSMAPMYYRNAHAALLVFDLTDYESFADVRAWLQQLHENVPHPIVLALIGNKLDLAESRAVPHAEAARLAATINGHYYETSTVNNGAGPDGVARVMDAVAQRLVRMLDGQQDDDGGNGAAVSATTTADVWPNSSGAVHVSEALDAGEFAATGVGRLETPSWSIDHIAHGYVQPSGWCCY